MQPCKSQERVRKLCISVRMVVNYVVKVLSIVLFVYLFDSSISGQLSLTLFIRASHRAELAACRQTPILNEAAFPILGTALHLAKSCNVMRWETMMSICQLWQWESICQLFHKFLPRFHQAFPQGALSLIRDPSLPQRLTTSKTSENAMVLSTFTVSLKLIV